MEKLIGPGELAEVLGVRKSWVYAQTRETGPGSMPRIRVKKYLRFNLQDVMNWLREQQDGNAYG